MPGNNEKDKALELAVGAIEKQYGKGTIMRLGEGEKPVEVQTVSTGALSTGLVSTTGFASALFPNSVRHLMRWFCVTRVRLVAQPETDCWR